MEEIVEGVYLAPISEAINIASKKNAPFKAILDVLETPTITHTVDLYGVKYIHNRILETRSKNLELLELHIYASKELLDNAVDIIDKNKPIVVCCAASIERSPLTVAYYISKKYNIDLKYAYQAVMAKHPMTQDRSHWIKE